MDNETKEDLVIDFLDESLICGETFEDENSTDSQSSPSRTSGAADEPASQRPLKRKSSDLVDNDQLPNKRIIRMFPLESEPAQATSPRKEQQCSKGGATKASAVAKPPIKIRPAPLKSGSVSTSFGSPQVALYKDNVLLKAEKLPQNKKPVVAIRSAADKYTPFKLPTTILKANIQSSTIVKNSLMKMSVPTPKAPTLLAPKAPAPSLFTFPVNTPPPVYKCSPIPMAGNRQAADNIFPRMIYKLTSPKRVQSTSTSSLAIPSQPMKNFKKETVITVAEEGSKDQTFTLRALGPPGAKEVPVSKSMKNSNKAENPTLMDIRPAPAQSTVTLPMVPATAASNALLVRLRAHLEGNLQTSSKPSDVILATDAAEILLLVWERCVKRFSESSATYFSMSSALEDTLKAVCFLSPTDNSRMKEEVRQLFTKLKHAMQQHTKELSKIKDAQIKMANMKKERQKSRAADLSLHQKCRQQAQESSSIINKLREELVSLSKGRAKTLQKQRNKMTPTALDIIDRADKAGTCCSKRVRDFCMKMYSTSPAAYRQMLEAFPALPITTRVIGWLQKASAEERKAMAAKSPQVEEVMIQECVIKEEPLGEDESDPLAVAEDTETAESE